MNGSSRKITGIFATVFFLIVFVVAFIIFPDIGEKIIYGKHPPEKKSESLVYREIIISGNYDCMESASIEAKGNFSEFVKEFNKCNS